MFNNFTWRKFQLSRRQLSTFTTTRAAESQLWQYWGRQATPCACRGI